MGRKSPTMDVTFGYPLVVLQIDLRVAGVYLGDFELEDWGFRMGSGLVTITLLPIRFGVQTTIWKPHH